MTAYDERVRQVADQISPHIEFTSLDEAKAFVNSYSEPESAEVPRRIRSMAEHFIEHPDRFGIEKLVLRPRRQRHPRTTISTVSEAIRVVAQRYAELFEALDCDKNTRLVIVA